MKKQALSMLLVLVLLITATAMMGQAETAGAYMVEHDGAETPVADLMSQWATGRYEYVKLYGEETLTIPEGTEVYVDLNGNNLTVEGAGALYAFNSANDGYAAATGSVTTNGAVTVAADVTAPRNGYRYLALTNGTVTTMHRIEMRLKAVTLRTKQAGLYYKAIYNCDAILAAAVKNYGVILSVNNMPGADFATETGDINKATSVTPEANFGNGTVTTSGCVSNIMETEQDSLTNYANADIKIYANAYIRLNTESVIVADTYNVGKTASSPDFDGIAYSLRDTLDSLDKNYYAYEKADRTTAEQFVARWEDEGICWEWEQLGEQTVVDNSDLNLVNGVAYCPVCKKDVQWTPVNSRDTVLKMSNGAHYYLAEALVTMNVPNATTHPNAANNANGAILAPDVAGQTACLHLNGNDLLAVGNSAIFAGRGTLNVMGEGEISGSLAKTGVGDAIQVNRATAVVNLYGGHYTKETAKGYIIALSSAGGTVNVYEAVTFGGCETEQTGYDIFRIVNGTISLHNVDLSDGLLAYASAADKKAMIQLWDAKISSISMNEWDTLELWGESVAKQITMPEDAKLTLGQLAPGASIGVKTAGGIITRESAYAKACIPYIKPSDTYQRVTLQDGALRCDRDYITSEPVQQGYCPVCRKRVTWTAVTGATTLTSGDHYYLAATQNYSGTDAFLNAPTSGTACFHLNGFDIHSTAAKAIYGASGTLNVMGTGTVTGYTATENDGAAVQVGSGAINLYGGIYQQATAAKDGAYTVASKNGGTINVYADAKLVCAEKDDKAIYVGAATGKNAVLGLYQTTVTGDVYVAGAQTGSAYTSQITVDGAVVAGNMTVDGINSMTLAHASKLSYLKLAKETVLTLGKLTDGADITVHTDGTFTAANEKAADYAAYFKAFNPAGSITAENNVLVYSVDYRLPLSFKEGTIGVCPLCEIEVQWTELKANEDGTMQTLPKDGHYYLATSQTFTAADTATQIAFVKAPDSGAACLHLNGQNLKATNVKAIYGSNGVLNVLGSGEVSGYSSSSNTGAAIQVNNGANGNAVNLYGGTYKRYNCGNTVAVVAIRNAGTINVYKDANIEGGNGTALYLGTARNNVRTAQFNLYGCTINGNVITATDATNKASILYAQNVTFNGEVNISAANNEVTFEGKTVIRQLNVAKGLLVNFVDMMEGSSVKVSADGTFTPVIGEADHYAPYFTTDDEGDWVICRDYTLTQEVQITSLPATEEDKTQLEDLYAGTSPYYGEMHNHTNTDGKDGNNSLEEWAQWMLDNDVDFTTIVDHKQSTHMYKDAWSTACFIGGSEPATKLLNSPAEYAGQMHYNMIFADAAKFEEHLKAITEFRFTAKTDDDGHHIGGDYSYANFTVERMQAVAQSVMDHGGFFVHVHPMFDGYIRSDDPEDYWFGDHTGIEITTTNGGRDNMGHESNVKAYEMWVDLLERNHRMIATIGDDNHMLSSVTSLSTIYSAEKTAQAFVNKYREGNITAGPVGIRMSIGTTATGGVTSFDEGKRLVLAVGDIHELVYDSDHKYGIELYNDGGILFSAEIDPTETTYFAMDIDTSRKFYRAVVVDLTEGVRIAVGNPVFNSEYYSTPDWLAEESAS